LRGPWVVVRPVSIGAFRVEHAQMTREDQLDAYKELGITPSFFVSHTYYWGDVHRDIFQGPVRAAHTSPLASARMARSDPVKR
jgi:predicted amidohydrolase YtcJ